jgi:hypothetical protein
MSYCSIECSSTRMDFTLELVPYGPTLMTCTVPVVEQDEADRYGATHEAGY